MLLTHSTDTFTYATDTWEDRLVSYNGQSIDYDDIGNPTTYLGASLTWRGRELANYTKGTTSIDYSYDVNSMRYQKVVKQNGTETARYDYVYSDGQLILLSYTANGATQKAKFVYDSAGEVLGFIVNGTTQYLYVKNLQGDIVSIVNESGVPVVRYIYDAWGNTTITTDSGYENLVNLSPFAYRGYCYDNDIKMYYLQSRYYDPQICRFINADSSEYLGATGTVLSHNLFAYCENDPVDYVDPKGTLYTYNVKKGTITGKFEKAKYNSSVWNNLHKKKANCYAYALNIVVNKAGTRHTGKLQPGELSGKLYTEYANKSMIVCIKSALISDLKVLGLKCMQVSSLTQKTPEQKHAEKNGYYIALVVTGITKAERTKQGNFWDYHWYRLDTNSGGKWSHKRGLLNVTNVDSKNKYITDVSKATKKYVVNIPPTRKTINYNSAPVYFLIYK